MKCEHGVHHLQPCPVLGCKNHFPTEADINALNSDIQKAIRQLRQDEPSDRHLFIIECEMIVDDCFNILDRLDNIEKGLDELKGL